MIDFNDEAGVHLWNETQMAAIRNWHVLRRAEGLNDDQLAQLWIRLFSADARRICGKYGVGVKTFELQMKMFENVIVSDIERLKYFLSQQQNGDVGLLATLEAIEHKVELLHGKNNLPVGVLMTLYFPPVEEGQSGHAAKVFFPIYEDDPDILTGQEERRDDFRRALSA